MTRAGVDVTPPKDINLNAKNPTAPPTEADGATEQN